MENTTELIGDTAKILREIRQLPKSERGDSLVPVAQRIAGIQRLIQNLFSDEKKGGDLDGNHL